MIRVIRVLKRWSFAGSPTNRFRKVFTVWTAGHSTRSTDELVDVLRGYDIELLVDVRRFPGSRRLPQFNRPTLESTLASHHIYYCWLESLGGRRRASATSVNVAWRNNSFRAYADYIATEEFASGLFELLMLARGLRTAIMCAEVLWWRCHRRIIADVLTSLGATVVHIRDASESEIHRLAAPARVVGGELVYF
jgi:uncharacterized protein (DUF488 family)